MCVIIVKQLGRKVPNEVLETSSFINPHGLGVMWLDTFEVTYHKSSQYGVLDTDRPYIAHFRYATIGAINKENTHPFACGNNPDEWLMMNGTINKLGNKHMSDSKHLAINLGKIPRHKWATELAQYECRFVTMNTRNKTFQIYNKHLWTQRDGVWYSKANVLQDNFVAVYGTLKFGYSNYRHYLTSSKFIGEGVTKDKYPLIIKGLPYLIEERGKGHNVEVDVFRVSDTVLEELDRLEGHPNWYRRKQIPIKINNKTVQCWIYFNIKEKAIGEFHSTYEQVYMPTKIWSFMDAEQSVIEKDCECDGAPICVDCTHDLEYDGFANYHCVGCDGWFTESEVLRFEP